MATSAHFQHHIHLLPWVLNTAFDSFLLYTFFAVRVLSFRPLVQFPENILKQLQFQAPHSQFYCRHSPLHQHTSFRHLIHSNCINQNCHVPVEAPSQQLLLIFRCMWLKFLPIAILCDFCCSNLVVHVQLSGHILHISNKNSSILCLFSFFRSSLHSLISVSVAPASILIFIILNKQCLFVS